MLRLDPDAPEARTPARRWPPTTDAGRERASTDPARQPPRRKRLGWLPRAVALAGALPLAKLVADGVTGHLGANPIEEGLNRLGFWTLTFLTASLAATPLNELVGLKWPVRIRRTLGLLAFAYGVLHFSWYLGVDKFFDLGDIARDITKRKFITVGFATVVLLLPLAVTSTDAWVRRLGYLRWKRLHRVVYAAAILGVVHFLWRVKADHRKPAVFAVIVAALLAVRVATWIARRPRRGVTPRWRGSTG